MFQSFRAIVQQVMKKKKEKKKTGTFPTMNQSSLFELEMVAKMQSSFETDPRAILDLGI